MNDDYCIENDLVRQQELEAIRQARLMQETEHYSKAQYFAGYEAAKKQAVDLAHKHRVHCLADAINQMQPEDV